MLLLSWPAAADAIPTKKRQADATVVAVRRCRRESDEEATSLRRCSRGRPTPATKKLVLHVLFFKSERNLWNEMLGLQAQYEDAGMAQWVFLINGQANKSNKLYLGSS